jgi:hypothetical protein
VAEWDNNKIIHMAISPLALGIGLQGKYDYKRQTMLDLARERGRAKAEAAEAEAKAKKRAPYERALMKVDTSGLLPYQAKLIKEKYADALQSFEDAPDDYSLHATNMQDINSSSKAFRDQAENYKRLSLTRDRMPADEEALTIIGTLSDPKAIQEGLSKLGPASSVQFANDQFLFSNPKYQGIGDSITKFVKSSMFDPEQGVNEFTIGDRKYGGADINTQVPGIITENIMRTDNLRQSAINDYLRYAQTNNIPYDFSTPESTNEFLNNTTKYVNDNAKKYIDTLSKQYGGSKTQFTTNVSMGTPESGMLGAPVETETVIETLSGKTGEQKSAKSLGFLPKFKNFEMTMPVTKTTIDATSGEVFSRGGDKNINATFNGADAYYVAKEDINFPGIKYRKGAIVDENDRGKLIRLGKLDVKFVVFGITDNDDEIYDSYDQAGVIPILGQSKTDGALIRQSLKEASVKFNQYKENLKQYQSAPSGNTGGSPAPAPKPKPSPAPGPTGSTNTGKKKKSAAQQAEDIKNSGL